MLTSTFACRYINPLAADVSLMVLLSTCRYINPLAADVSLMVLLSTCRYINPLAANFSLILLLVTCRYINPLLLMSVMYSKISVVLWRTSRMQDFEKNSMKKASKKRWRWSRKKDEKDAIQLKPLNSGQCIVFGKYLFCRTEHIFCILRLLTPGCWNAASWQYSKGTVLTNWTCRVLSPKVTLRSQLHKYYYIRYYYIINNIIIIIIIFYKYLLDFFHCQ